MVVRPVSGKTAQSNLGVIGRPQLLGAYGVAVTGLDAEGRLLAPAEPDWPVVRIHVDPRPADSDETALDAGSARYPDVRGGHVTVDREAGVACFRGADPPASDEIVHPRLGMLGAVYAQWLSGRTAFHAGAFVTGERAWAVVGARHDGKSTLMAALALAGVAVLGDDTLVLDGRRCLPGARCVDLRPDTAVHLGAGERVVTVRRGDRERLFLDAPPPAATLAGWLFLSWGDGLSLRPLAAPERVARVASTQGWHRRGVTDPAELLDLASLPAWELSRPRDWALMPRVVERVRELTAG
jgi:hypothetical protein